MYFNGKVLRAFGFESRWVSGTNVGSFAVCMCLRCDGCVK
jgi:hypothetical protein